MSGSTTDPDRLAPVFDRKSRSYSSHAIVQKDAAVWLAEWLPQNARKQSCLEFGAGTGFLTAALVSRFAQVVATDVSGTMLKICQEAIPEAEYKMRDAWAPATDESTWNYLASSSLLQWAPKPIEVLRNWKSQLKKDGRILVGFFVDPTLSELSALRPDWSPIRWQTIAEWQRVAENADLKVLRIDSSAREYQYPSALAFLKSLHETGATVPKRVSTGQMRRLLRDYEALFNDISGVRATWTFCRMELGR